MNLLPFYRYFLISVVYSVMHMNSPHQFSHIDKKAEIVSFFSLHLIPETLYSVHTANTQSGQSIDCCTQLLNIRRKQNKKYSKNKIGYKSCRKIMQNKTKPKGHLSKV